MTLEQARKHFDIDYVFIVKVNDRFEQTYINEGYASMSARPDDTQGKIGVFMLNGEPRLCFILDEWEETR